MSLPNDHFQHETKVALRIAACASTFVLLRFMGRVFTHLGNQWHMDGRREKPRVMHTGPYAVVRHPLYTNVLIHLSIAAGTFAVKIPTEASGSTVTAEYRAYMQRVPVRVIPFLW
ncbi:hypothetical protein BDR03DRAFT_951679 [Suillus americanus]|nr:hypothetical protein BDR03DRAFT_951679 [Suillus americanus]